ncbi:MAG: SprT family zinc-dependent metalloprotease [Actinomyces ruminicola]|nr:SprT family zinc-dependent metalloprotease [Actinomyces ruminicola]
MNLPDVLALARVLMEEHGLADWSVSLDRARRRAGQTDHSRRRITLSRHLMALYDEAEVRETVLHEIAHARVGSTHRHDAVWRTEARRIGASGHRLVSSRAPRVAGRWVGTCPAGHTVDRMRRPALPCSCSRCARGFSVEHLLSWSYDGEPVSPQEIGPGYARALARLERPQA